MIENLDINFLASLAAIGGFLVTVIGAAVGIYGYCSYWMSWRRKTKALVTYLKGKKVDAEAGKNGQHTAIHLTRYVGLTEDEILKISFESPHVKRSISVGKDGKAETLLFEYER